MIKNIVFDMGNVLRVFDKDLFLDRVGATGEDRTLLKNEVFLSLDWARMDRGSRTDETALLGMLENLPKRLHSVAAKLVLEWDKNVDPMPGMEGLIRDLKQRGYCIYLLSNASYRAHEYWLNTPGHEYFDGALFSCDVKMIKPDICIYRELFNRFSILPEESLFVDDLPANVEGAERAGMSGIVFHMNSEELRDKLKRMNVL